MTLLTTAESAARLGCHRQYIHNLIRDGKLKVTATRRGKGYGGKNYLFDVAVIDRLVRNGYGGCIWRSSTGDKVC